MSILDKIFKKPKEDKIFRRNLGTLAQPLALAGCSQAVAQGVRRALPSRAYRLSGIAAGA